MIAEKKNRTKQEVPVEIKDSVSKKSETKKPRPKSREQKSLEKLKNQVGELNEKNLRLQAEFANYKRRNEKEKEELSTFIKMEVLKNFLPLKDDFSRLHEFLDHEPEKLSEGVTLIVKKIDQFFDSYHVKEILAEGAEFDPELHDALMMQPVEKEDLDNKVLQVFEPGFTINDRVIRHARVVVGKKQ